MLKAINMITEAKKSGSISSEAVTVDLHPVRPDYRGFMVGKEKISMQAYPSFVEIEQAGGIVEKSANAHTVLDDMFLVSGRNPARDAKTLLTPPYTAL